VHAAPADEFAGLTPGNETVPYVSRYLDETQITDGHGNVLARLAYEDGEGVGPFEHSWTRRLRNKVPPSSGSRFASSIEAI
jgi:hypothetical protein